MLFLHHTHNATKTHPGHTPTTLTLASLSARAKLLINPIVPCLLALYKGVEKWPCSPAIEDVIRTTPFLPWPVNARIAIRVSFIGWLRLTSRAAYLSSSASFQKLENFYWPILVSNHSRKPGKSDLRIPPRQRSLRIHQGYLRTRDVSMKAKPQAPSSYARRIFGKRRCCFLVPEFRTLD